MGKGRPDMDEDWDINMRFLIKKDGSVNANVLLEALQRLFNEVQELRAKVQQKDVKEI